jgi:putative two-component system response regulator
LKGEDIPSAARLMAAHACGALTTRRVYKPAFPCSEAVDGNESRGGRYFDPSVVDAF